MLTDKGLLHDVYWSLNCEIIYYFLYPLILKLRKILNWPVMIGLAYVISGLIVYNGTPKAYMQDFGDYLNWIVWLPVWMMGCHLAEKPTFRKLSPTLLCLLRGGIWFLASFAVLLTWKFNIGIPRTLFLFSIPGYFWIQAEIGSFTATSLAKRLENLGIWSYSLYLTHPLILWGAVQLMGQRTMGIGFTLLVVIVVLLVAYVFYQLVEKPSVQLARFLSTRWTSRESGSLH
ncbi:acyltransferase family protein [Armatimonas sp.]|uniref:acyltransferase family protein n=1 Tax=Armatimonas sp. TaxID=1872638 RepID=UPI00374D00FC